MDRKFLEELGLEKESIDKIMKEHGKTLNDTKKKADQVDGLETQIEDLEGQIEQRDTQLKELKKVDPEALQERITELETENENQKKQYETDLKDERLNNAIKTALTGQVHDEEVATGLIDKEKLVISDDGKVVGLDEQLTGLKESKAYLFKSDDEENPEDKPGFKIGGDGKGTPPSDKPLSLAESIAQRISK